MAFSMRSMGMMGFVTISTLIPAQSSWTHKEEPGCDTSSWDATVITPAQDRLLGSLDLVRPTDRQGVRRGVQELRVLLLDAQQRVGEGVEGFLAFRLSWLDHQRLGDDQGKVDRR